ncbi:MAG: transposase [Kiritimatiellae bacterium]|nr:transposase [Kiritimatiellia bacterium]
MNSPEILSPEARALPRAIQRYRRYHGYDYSRGASLFITISTEPRSRIFGMVRNAKVELSPLGKIVDESILSISQFNPAVSVYEHVVMPDHVHFNLHLASGLENPLKILGSAIRKFKTYTTTMARKLLKKDKIWQQGYHDYLLLSERFIDSTARYINYNPLKYELRYNQPEFLHLHEPVISPRFDPCDYWKAIGELSLLDPSNKILSLRVSRKVKDLKYVVKRMIDASNAGYTILSGFISPGEIAVRDALLKMPNAKLIKIFPDQISHSHKPDSRFLKPIQEHRLLEIGRGNEDIEFARAACLDLNEEIIKIAHAGEGLSIYWLPEGPFIARFARPGLHLIYILKE